MIQIRDLEDKDIKQLRELTISFLDESPVFRHFSRDETKWFRQMKNIITNDHRKALVAMDNETMAGFIIGNVCEFYLTEDLVSYDNLVYVAEKYRNLDTITKLIRAYENWAINTMKAKVLSFGTSASINSDKIIRLYEHLGYKQTGHLFYKRAS